jgi:hypothetical protein
VKKSAKMAIISGIAIVAIISALAVTVHLRLYAIEGNEENTNETTSHKINEIVNSVSNPNVKENTTNSEASESPEQLASEGSSNQTIPYMTMKTCNAINDVLPDPKCTSGAIDPRVTQDNIDSTICVSGYTKTVRPPVSVTEPLKLESMKSYGFSDFPSNYEYDHLIPLEIGGAPDDVKNLWPEPHYTNPNSYDKDRFENYLHGQVCSGAMDLKAAQNEIATNWVKYWDGAGQP